MIMGKRELAGRSTAFRRSRVSGKRLRHPTDGQRPPNNNNNNTINNTNNDNNNTNNNNNNDNSVTLNL